jgi:hypothetical protein
MTRRVEKRQQRILGLLKHLQAAARREVAAKPQDSGRHGEAKTSFAERRERTVQKLKVLLRQLREAVKRQPPGR